MRYLSAKRPSRHLLACTCAAAILLVGCGSSSGDGPTTESGGGSSAPTSSRPNAPAVEAGSLAVPPGGPKTITEFPIPGGAQIVDLGPSISGSWQFGISSPDSATTVEFYRKTLAAQGYTLKENVSLKVGVNTVEYDLAFYGTTYGVVDANPALGGTFVTVADRPIRGLTP